MTSLTFENVAAFCARLDFSAAIVSVDLSRFEFVELAALIYLGMLLRSRAGGVSFRFTPPTAPEPRAFMDRQNFWSRFRFRNPPERRSFSSSTSLGEIVDIERAPGVADRIEQDVARVLERNISGIDIPAIRTMVGELVANFAEHAQGPLAAMAMQVYRRGNFFDIAIGDCGTGIRTSLARNPAHADVLGEPHWRAAELALLPGVGGRASGEGGWGLHAVREEIRHLGGELRLYTGDGAVEVRRDRLRRGPLAFDLPGVQIRLRIPYPR